MAQGRLSAGVPGPTVEGQGMSPTLPMKPLLWPSAGHTKHRWGPYLFSSNLQMHKSAPFF